MPPPKSSSAPSSKTEAGCELNAMAPLLRTTIKKSLQKMFWIYLTNNFVITSVDDFKNIKPAIRCEFLPITLDNHSRVRDFREESRVSEYRVKLTHKEIGFFTEFGGKMVGSIWATVNNLRVPAVVRSYVKLMPNEALIHDVVTAEKFRGMGVGPFMLVKMCSVLLDELEVSKIIIDVNVRNTRSLRMMDKAGLEINQKMLSISAFGKLVSQMLLKQYR
jgi:ribosomal protein S18 acetylase RimI-like enzyme